ncbi:MAG: glycosyltransferase family 4 protein [Planctomycetes bacterium]|nr:glycosyltransferase family 4 protein [Planctomycetota bacterium]
MEIGPTDASRLKICMLLPLRYNLPMRIVPQIGICSYLTNFGHEVSWVISSHEHKKMQEFSWGDVTIYTTPHYHYFHGGSTFTGSFNIIPYIFNRIRLVLKIFREGKYDLILVRDSAFDGLIAAYIKKKYGVPFVFVLSNPLMFGRVDALEHKKLKHLHYSLVKFGLFVSTRLIHHADLVLPISKWLGKDLVGQNKVPASRVVALPEGVDIRVFSDRDNNSVSREWFLQDSKVIVYLGSMDRARQLSLIIDAFAKIKQERKGVKLLMVGDGTDRIHLEQHTQKLGIADDVIFTGQIPQNRIPDFISAADIGVCPVPPLPFYKYSSPIKVFEYMAMAKPVVANEEIPEQDEVLKESEGGILVPFNADYFAAAIIKLLDNPESAATMGQMGRKWVSKNRTYEGMAREVERRYYNLLENSGGNNDQKNCCTYSW